VGELGDHRTRARQGSVYPVFDTDSPVRDGQWPRRSRSRLLTTQLIIATYSWWPPLTFRHFRRIVHVNIGNHRKGSLAQRMHCIHGHGAYRSRPPMPRQPSTRISTPPTGAKGSRKNNFTCCSPDWDGVSHFRLSETAGIFGIF